MIPMKTAAYTRLPIVDRFESDEEGSNDSLNSASDQLNPQTDDSDGQEVTRMKQNLGLLSGISIIIGNVIGSGIFVSPKGVLIHSGSVGMSIIAWLFCGLVALLGALSYVELGLSYPTSGGVYLYIFETVGELPAFLVLWISLLARISTNFVILAMTFANYLLYGLFTCVHPPDSAVVLISALLITLVTFINVFSVKCAAYLQTITVFGKLTALVIITVTGIVHLLLGHTENLQPETIMNGTNTDPGELALAVYAGLFAYSGWDSLNVLIEELRDPCRLLPLAVCISIPIITTVYLLTNVAYFSVLNVSQLLHSPAVAVSFSYATMGFFAFVMPLFVACSTLGGANGSLLCSSRTTFVAARKGHLPKTLAMLNIKYLTPVPSILMLSALSLLMLVGQDVYRLITYVSFLDLISLVTPIVGMLVQRYKDRERSRPFRVWTVVPVLYIIICALLLVLPWYVSPVETGIGLALCLSGIPVYLLGIRNKRKPKWFKILSMKLCRFIQKLTLSVSEDGE